ncbi:LCP family protein [Cryobacterium sp. CG_9.6]|uniref:LCP family protein n=1 Tax=Cryobacterium sp. CG_9.6 TaxID=2760710 RepID=UPI0024749C07|nr:LCP family protein [Cryobacterium sp. CG_9.6]MDH6235366.1 LCP family protein required for cell wall assembly [Cryobacterium sp. CG_9.6]
MTRPTKAQTPRKRTGWRIALISVGTVVLLVAGGAGAYAWNLTRTFDTKTQKITEVFPENEANRPAELEGEAAKSQNILLLGTDTRGSINGSIDDISGQRSDTVMVVNIPADRTKISVMSIMRDSWLEVPGYGQAKINAALSYGGVPLAVETVEGLLGVRMDHVAIIDFDGFTGVTDALGGVDIENSIGFNSYHLKGHYFEPGTLHVNGTEALAFVRERYAFQDGDFQRTRNQQIFIQAVLKQALSAETLTSPGKVSALIGAVAPYLAVDDGFNSSYVAGLGVELRSVRVGDVNFFTLPTLGTGTAGGQSVVNIDWNELPLLQQAFQSDALAAYQPPA